MWQQKCFKRQNLYAALGYEVMMERHDLVSTGVKALDELLGGGLLRGSIVLVAGHPGAGKTTLGAQFLYYGAVKKNESGIYVSFAESKREFYYHMKQLGMNFERLEKEGKFKFIEGISGISRDFLRELINTIASVIEEIRAERIVIDSITALLMYFKEEEARTFFREVLMRLLKPHKITAYFIADLPHGKEVIGFGFEEFLADVVIRLAYEGVPGIELVRRRLIVEKSRYSPTPRYAYDFEIGKGGIRIFTPIEEVPLGSYELERVSTGIPGLDKMLGGGLLKSSLTIISGPSGTGETVISMMFAVEGALRGERVLYLSFEESEKQLIRMLNTMGFNYEKLKNNLTILYKAPRLLTLGQVLSIVTDALEKYKPSRLVIDGISALERMYRDQFTLHALIRGVAALCKSRGITVIMTTLRNILRGEEAGYSTAADILIGLDLERKDVKLQRVIAILKMRGSPHDTNIRKIEFNERGRVVIHG